MYEIVQVRVAVLRASQERISSAAPPTWLSRKPSSSVEDEVEDPVSDVRDDGDESCIGACMFRTWAMPFSWHIALCLGRSCSNSNVLVYNITNN